MTTHRIIGRTAVHLLLLLLRTPLAAQGDAPRFASVAAGQDFSCGLTADGALYCWGGERVLGGVPDGWNHGMERIAPERRFDRVVAGASHICGVSAGSTYCWQLGGRTWQLSISAAKVQSCDDCDQAALRRLAASLGHPIRQLPHAPGSPVSWFLFPDFASPAARDLVPGAGALSTLAAGFTPSAGSRATTGWCGLDAAGVLRCWHRDYEQGSAAAPVAVGGTQRFSSFAVGDVFGCGQATSGATWCWGDGPMGEIGPHRPGVARCQDYDQPSPCTRAPVQFAGGRAFRAMVAGAAHVCALTPEGKAWCWGSDDQGQLGRGAQAPVLPWSPTVGRHGATAPGPVAGDLTFASLAAGPQYTCGLTTDGAVYCWGLASTEEVLGGPIPGEGETCQAERDHTPLPCATRPLRIGGSLRLRQLATAVNHACGVDPQGVAWCWGANTGGQLGRTGTDIDFTPAPVSVPVFPPGQTASRAD